MKTLLIIGIGAGNPDHLTVQAIAALNRCDVIFIMDKGEAKASMITLRRQICERFITDRAYRFAEAQSPQWDRNAGQYSAVVDGLNRDKQAVFEQLIADSLNDGETGGILVWGDPSLYDSTIRIVEQIAGSSEIAYEVFPGISSLHALTAAHRTTLNTIGGSVVITTGRRLASGLPADADSIFVMLDADSTYRQFAADPALEIFWGAYIGTPDEILIAGRLHDVANEIERRRSTAKQAHGWIMDSYLLRKTGK